MKVKSILCILVLLILKGGFAQIPQSPNKINSNGRKEGRWTILFNGSWKESQNPDSIRFYRRISFLDGVPVGVVKDYYLSGKIQMTGKLKSADSAVYDDGLVTWFYENGIIETQCNYLNGKRNGAYSMNYSNGKTCWQGFMRNGKKDSLNVFCYPNGVICVKINFHQDTIWNVLAANDSLGRPLHWGDLKDGSGNLTEFYLDGKKSSEGQYLKGIREGSWKEYDTTGGWWEGNYIKGKKDGKEK